MTRGRPAVQNVLTILTLIVIGAAPWSFSGCSSPEADQMASKALVDASAAKDSSGFGLDVTLCRKIGSKTGRRIGAGTEFRMAKKSRIRALVDFTAVRPERDYTVHLVWIRPDGREMFRKYGEARQTELTADSFQTVVSWLDGVDLHQVKTDTLSSKTPEFTLESRFNTSLAKQREPGTYQFRVYLDRRLVSENAFTLEG